jgi:2-phosphoglycerate kinase
VYYLEGSGLALSGSCFTMTNPDAILWLGGAPCAGKSSVAEVLVRRFDIEVYRVDEAFDAHVCQLDEHTHPALLRWTTSSWDERWIRPPEALLADVIACYREHLSFVLEDLRSRVWSSRLVVVEGSAVLPDEIAPILRCRERGMWLIPTLEFQRHNYARRNWVGGILQQCADPDIAFRNWMERDARFAQWVAGQVRDQGLASIEIDGSRSVDQIADVVARHFGLTGF